MYPECRHVLTSGEACNSPALAKSHWCYFHTRLYQRQGQRQAARHAHRRPDGRFAALPAPGANHTDIHATDTIDYGPYPVGGDHREPPTPDTRGSASAQTASFDLPPVEDTESIQLALIDVIQALAANQIDTKRAGLLLYGLQVASANAHKLHRSLSGGVRAVTYTEDGTPLAPQVYGYDIEDYNDDEDEEDSESE